MFKSLSSFYTKAKLYSPFTHIYLTTSTSTKPPVKIAVTGAAGKIGYDLTFKIASGEMFGKDQPVYINLIDLPQSQDVLKGIMMEFHDCAFPLLQGITATDCLAHGFKDIDYAILVGAKPRELGIERRHLLNSNAKIFIDQGKALNHNAKRTCKILVVGNPANTNALITAQYAKDIPKENFSAMTRLDHNRALYQLANKVHVHIKDIQRLAIWGNHSPTMYPDITKTTIKGEKATELVDREWIDQEFIPSVQQRGTTIIKTKKMPSVASAANAAIDHMRDWVYGTDGKWTSMGIISDGSYGIEPGVVFSYPVTISNGRYSIVKNLEIDPESQARIETSNKELCEERKEVEDLLPQGYLIFEREREEQSY